MKVIYSIKVHKDNLSKLEKMDCFSSVGIDSNGRIACQFKDNKTRGSLIARTGDFVVQFASGEWQRFGSEAYSILIKNPSAKGAQWEE